MTGEAVGNHPSNPTYPTNKTIDNNRGRNPTSSLSDITGEVVGNHLSSPTINKAYGLGTTLFLPEIKNYVGDQKAGNCPSSSTTSALVGNITTSEPHQPSVDVTTNTSNSNSTNNISNNNINTKNNIIEAQQAGNCPSNASTNNINNYSIVLWHNQLVHINPHRIKLMLIGLVTGGSKLAEGVLLDCLACAQGKNSIKGISKIPVTRATIKFFRMHIDLGIIGIKSIAGNLYFCTITNHIAVVQSLVPLVDSRCSDVDCQCSDVDG